MAKKQTRRSISVSRSTYERLKSFCETQGISMSQFVENRVGDFLSTSDVPVTVTPLADLASASRPMVPRPAPAPRQYTAPRVAPSAPAPAPVRAVEPARSGLPMTSAAARFAVEPPPPIIKPRPEPVDVKPPVAPTADQIFTF